jgi:hypothetical protein
MMGAGQGKLCVPVLLAALLAGCGGSGSSSAERTKLVNKLAAHTAGLPPDLGRCVYQRARDLPLPQLRAVANAGANPSPATKRTAIGLLTGCVEQGHGVAALRGVIVKEVNTSVPKTLPTSFRDCIEARANAISANELSRVISAFATESGAAARANGERLGRSLALRCLDQPAVLGSLRELFLAPIRHFARTSHFSAAFRYCVLHKAQKISLAQLKRFALNPAGATAQGVEIGRGFARACIASGATP